MRKAAFAAMIALTFVIGACDNEDDVTNTTTNSCANLSGTYAASSFTAQSTSNASLSNNFLTNGGAYTLGYNNGSFNSSYTSTTGATPMTVSGTATTSG